MAIIRVTIRVSIRVTIRVTIRATIRVTIRDTIRVTIRATSTVTAPNQGLYRTGRGYTLYVLKPHWILLIESEPNPARVRPFCRVGIGQNDKQT